MDTSKNPKILTEDIIRRTGFKPNPNYNPEHLLQMAHSANLQMTIELNARKREWNAVLQDGKAGREAKFEVRTLWSDPTDCMNLLVSTIYYHPNSPSPDGSVFFITERILAISMAGRSTIESPLKSFVSEKQMVDYLAEEDTPFKRYQHLEHVMERMRESEGGQEMRLKYLRMIQVEEEAKNEAEKAPKEPKKVISPEDLYLLLGEPKYRYGNYMAESLEEGMRVLKESINGWYKPRFLVDDDARKAYEFMDTMLILQTVTEEDINWGSLKGLPEKALTRAKDLSGLYPTFIRRYQNGEAEVTWQINPDGRYFQDEDGYGMTDDEEITLVGKIDRTGKVTQRFRYRKQLIQ